MKGYTDVIDIANSLPETRICSQCERLRHIDDFRPHNGRPDGLHTQCRFCHNEAERFRRERKKHDKIHEIAITFDVNPAVVRGIIDMWKE